MQNTEDLYRDINPNIRQTVRDEVKNSLLSVDWIEDEREKIRKEIMAQFEQPTPAIPCTRNPDFACKGICNGKCAFQKSPE